MSIELLNAALSCIAIILLSIYLGLQIKELKEEIKKGKNKKEKWDNEWSISLSISRWL